MYPYKGLYTLLLSFLFFFCFFRSPTEIKPTQTSRHLLLSFVCTSRLEASFFLSTFKKEMPITHCNNNKHNNKTVRSNSLGEKKWWQKLAFVRKSKSTSTSQRPDNTAAQDWRTLSPNDPPLPFLLSVASPSTCNTIAVSTLTNPCSVVPSSIKFSEADRFTSELAPIFKVPKYSGKGRKREGERERESEDSYLYASSDSACTHAWHNEIIIALKECAREKGTEMQEGRCKIH